MEDNSVFTRLASLSVGFFSILTYPFGVGNGSVIDLTQKVVMDNQFLYSFYQGKGVGFNSSFSYLMVSNGIIFLVFFILGYFYFSKTKVVNKFFSAVFLTISYSVAFPAIWILLCLKMKNNKTRLIILFSNSKKFLSRFSFKDNDIIIGTDNSFEFQTLTFINPRDIALEDYSIIGKINKLFDLLSRRDPDLKCYVNNFYDCSFSVFAQYILAIDIAIKKYDISEAILPSELKYGVKTFNYFLSEYESQGKYFYNREDIFAYFLVDHFKNIGLKYSFCRTKISVQWFNNKIRLIAVFILRFYKDLINSKFLSSIHLELNSFEPDFVYIARSKSQYNAIKILTRDSLYNHLILIGKSITNDLNQNNIKNDKKNVKAILLFKNSYIETIQTYFSCFIKLLRISSIILVYKNLKLNFDQSIKEIVVMLPGLKLYKLQICEKL